MKILLIKFLIIFLLLTDIAFSQVNSEINETYYPIQKENLEDLFYQEQEELNNNKNVQDFIKELENSNIEIRKSFQNNEIEVNNQINSSNLINLDNELNTKPNQSEEIIFNSNTDDQIKNVLNELSNENVANNSIGLINEVETNDINNNIPEVSSQTLEELSVSSVGVFRENFLFPDNVWNNIDIDRAKEILEISKVKFSSKSMRKIFFDLLVSAYQYPLGDEKKERELFVLRMNLLKHLGQINDFREFIYNLSNEESFDEWKSWIVKDAFLKLEDEYACEIVEKISSRNISEFWQLSQIFCLLITGREEEALFTSELVKASGLKDKNFYILLDSMFNNSSSNEMDLDNLNLLHIVMMDQLKNTIPPEFISKVPNFMLSALLNLKHIQPDLKAIIIDVLVDQRFADRALIEKHYLKIGDESNLLSDAIATMKKSPGPQSRADVWLKIKNEESNLVKNLSSIEIIFLESLNGRAIQALELYFPLMNSNETKEIYDVLDILYQFNMRNNLFEDVERLKQSNQKLVDILSFDETKDFSFDFLKNLNSLDLMPVLNEFGLFSDNPNFFNNISKINKNNVLNNVHPLLKLTLDDARNNKRIPELICLLLLIIEDKKLNEVSSYEVVEIIQNLKAIGLTQNAREFALEWIINRSLNEMTSSYLKFEK